MKSIHAILFILLSLVLLAGVVACAGSDTMMEKPMNTAMEGMLVGSEGHHAAGKVTIDKGMGSQSVLTLSDINIDKVPDGYVYLARGSDLMNGVELGRLNQFSGTVSFELPPGVNTDDFDRVVVWCKKFKTEIGRATLPKKMM